jgi:hypothetical protein
MRKKNWLGIPDGCLTARRTGRLTIGRKLTSTSTSMVIHIYSVYGILVYGMYGIYGGFCISRHFDHFRIQYNTKLKVKMKNYCLVIDLRIDGF